MASLSPFVKLEYPTFYSKDETSSSKWLKFKKLTDEEYFKEQLLVIAST